MTTFPKCVNVILQLQQVTQLQKEVAALQAENQSVKAKFEVSANETKGESRTSFEGDIFLQNLRTVSFLTENFDQIKRILADEKEHEARLRK